jgi:ubiquinone/menaquinone biosynthesis C-methylase UbiE
MPTTAEQIAKIRAFWDERARTHGTEWTATLGESFLRLIEIRTMMEHIRANASDTVFDVGCGNGYSTVRYANAFPSKSFIGIDYSEEMIAQAGKHATPNCRFVVGDVLRLETFPSHKADLIVTQRCLQNIPGYDLQKRAIENLRTRLHPRGSLLLMECSRTGLERLQKYRQVFGKPPLEGIEPWHNTFLHDERLVEDFSATIVHFCSTYMFFAKVIEGEGKAERGYELPNVGSFGYDKLYVIKALRPSRRRGQRRLDAVCLGRGDAAGGWQ